MNTLDYLDYLHLNEGARSSVRTPQKYERAPASAPVFSKGARSRLRSSK